MKNPQQSSGYVQKIKKSFFDDLLTKQGLVPLLLSFISGAPQIVLSQKTAGAKIGIDLVPIGRGWSEFDNFMTASFEQKCKLYIVIICVF